VNKVINESLSLVSHQKDFHQLDLELDLSDDLPAVKADDNQLQQVFVNLILNAFDSMPNGGKLSIRSELSTFLDESDSFVPKRKSDLTSTWARLKKSEEQNITSLSVRISISDNGEGIKSSDLPKIFDPFFTTKEPGKGTGLGLSISQRIIEVFNGRIEVESKLKKGSTFTVFIHPWENITN
jgi:signal transduction histidine kinase